MITPDTNEVRLVIADLYPLGEAQKTKHLLHSEPLTVENGLSFGQKVMRRLPENMRGRAFIEGVTAPATVELVCEHCNNREKPRSVVFLKNLLGID